MTANEIKRIVVSLTCEFGT